ncbi:transposase [Kitasatospora sp. NPDC087314]|uniref:transposase n=1 Tax=Kitasatospora sp. NPDC087314 TaxID=3364068 RepID=UPI00382B509E
MSMRPREQGGIPLETVRVARAAFPKGSLAIRVRDELGVLFTDELFADLFPTRGKPAWSPGRLALVLVLQFVEGLTDRQVAEAVRVRIDFKYALGIVAARREHGVELHGPIRADTTAQAAAEDGAFTQNAFTIDWDNQRVACPGGRTTDQWRQAMSHPGTPVIRVAFSATGCRPCPPLRNCVSSPKAVHRELTFRHRDEHQAIGQARALQQTDDWKKRYKIRAGVEGTISQGIQRCGLRRSRYQGLAKTNLQHQLTGAAINLARIDAHLTETPRARTRTSHFARLRPAEQRLDGAK